MMASPSAATAVGLRGRDASRRLSPVNRVSGGAAAVAYLDNCGVEVTRAGWAR
jgi:hypothetical protein